MKFLHISSYFSFLSSHLSSFTPHSHSSITMLGKKILFGAFAVLASLAATVVADNVIALDPDNFDKAGPWHRIIVFPLSWTQKKYVSS